MNFARASLADAGVLADAILDYYRFGRGALVLDYKDDAHLGRVHKRLVQEAGGERVLAGLVFPYYLALVNKAIAAVDRDLTVVWGEGDLLIRRRSCSSSDCLSGQRLASSSAGLSA